MRHRPVNFSGGPPDPSRQRGAHDPLSKNTSSGCTSHRRRRRRVVVVYAHSRPLSWHTPRGWEVWVALSVPWVLHHDIPNTIVPVPSSHGRRSRCRLSSASHPQMALVGADVNPARMRGTVVLRGGRPWPRLPAGRTRCGCQRTRSNEHTNIVIMAHVNPGRVKYLGLTSHSPSWTAFWMDRRDVCDKDRRGRDLGRCGAVVRVQKFCSRKEEVRGDSTDRPRFLPATFLVSTSVCRRRATANRRSRSLSKAWPP